jgi:hypothetical protein
MTAKYDDRVTNFIPLHESEQNTRGHQYKIKKQHVRHFLVSAPAGSKQ